MQALVPSDAPGAVGAWSYFVLIGICFCACRDFILCLADFLFVAGGEGVTLAKGVPPLPFYLAKGGPPPP